VGRVRERKGGRKSEIGREGIRLSVLVSGLFRWVDGWIVGD
jgi:hypothetical protein